MRTNERFRRNDYIYFTAVNIHAVRAVQIELDDVFFLCPFVGVDFSAWFMRNE